MSRRQIIAMLSCLVIGIIGFAGAYAVEKARDNTDQVAEEEQQEPKEEVIHETSTIISPAPNNSTVVAENTATEEDEDTETMAEASKKEDTEASEKEEESEETAETVAEAKDNAIHFTPQDGLRWPLEGEVLLNYSMDYRTYFPTLEEFRYNPALVIGGDVNSKVYLIAKGTITDISTNEETGCTVKEDLGDGYTAIYGQLKEVNFSVGDTVERGQVIGYVSEPTKYYSVEGSNLYFAMEKDGKPIDPLEYFE